jgi:SNF family Na+-dependent transporter
LGHSISFITIATGNFIIAVGMRWYSQLFCRDAVLTCVINTLTSIIPSLITFSILGFIATFQGSTVNDVVESGPGLVFITYPQVVLQLPGARIWAIIFFVMLAVGMAA